MDNLETLKAELTKRHDEARQKAEAMDLPQYAYKFASFGEYYRDPQDVTHRVNSLDDIVVTTKTDWRGGYNRLYNSNATEITIKKNREIVAKIRYFSHNTKFSLDSFRYGSWADQLVEYTKDKLNRTEEKKCKERIQAYTPIEDDHE